MRLKPWCNVFWMMLGAATLLAACADQTEPGNSNIPQTPATVEESFCLTNAHCTNPNFPVCMNGFCVAGNTVVNPSQQPSGGDNPSQQPSGGDNPSQQPSGGDNPSQQPSGGDNPSQGEQPQKPTECRANIDCPASYTCISGHCQQNPDNPPSGNPEDNVVCSTAKPCPANTYCLNNACVKPGDACKEKSAACVGNMLVQCTNDPWNSESSESWTENLIYTASSCGSKTCAAVSSVTACYEPCSSASQVKHVCDIDSGEDGDSLTASFTYSCQSVGGKYYFVKTATIDCGTQFCDTATGECYQSWGGNVGDKCQTSSDCQLSLYCDLPANAASGTCQRIAYLGDSCTSDAACSTHYCDPASKTCKIEPVEVEKLSIGAACNESSACKSGYCDASGHCADTAISGVDSAAECLTTADCAATLKCNADYKCVAIEGLGLGESCTAASSLLEGLFCNSKGVVALEGFQKDGKTCSGDYPVCIGEALVKCSSEGEFAQGTYSVESCIRQNKMSQTCIMVSGKGQCAELCDEIGDTKQTCWDYTPIIPFTPARHLAARMSMCRPKWSARECRPATMTRAKAPSSP